ncbi:MAG: DUF86 domain-containing protein [Sphingobacteriales bacterium]|nr:MAG: DUF86 domain-containing protein [Sphingobacteriales bacterium]
MDTKIKAWLYDILNAIVEIESFFDLGEKTFEYYQSDLRTRRAIERNIEIIGEALSRLLKFDESIAISNSRQIVDTRNRIIHGYDSVSDEVIWGIVVKHLPVLKQEVDTLLGE